MGHQWIQIPADDALATRSGWTQDRRDKKRFVATRTHILVVQTVLPSSKRGPVLQQLHLAADAELMLGKKFISVVSYSETFSESISSAVAEKISHEVGSER